MKSRTGREWRDIAAEYEALADHWHEVAERRGESLTRVWLGIETMVDDPDLANSLRLLILGDFLPDLIIMTENTPEEGTTDG